MSRARSRQVAAVLVVLLVAVGVAGPLGWWLPDAVAGLVGALLGGAAGVGTSLLLERYDRRRDAAREEDRT